MDNSLVLLTALLPLAAGLVVVQTNPYRALVVRGILGSVAALVYALLGAADVALTEALVGTLLAVILYAVAVRSSLVVRLGVLAVDLDRRAGDLQTLMTALRRVLGQQYVQVEWVTYGETTELAQALADQKVHAICTCPEPTLIHTTTQVHRLYEILQREWPTPMTVVYQPVAIQGGH
ncbi:Putative subunit of the Multisubunit Na+/H+ antiporter [Gloeomargarita lithophora Alchichica-D10]|uniref:Subunit of the Multisubunit Na+/H+ antiporter n=1 Tax=Gloeomargarita lithophora Alchichica-D10 TaxID=1188229 RepID=A0A1J0A9A7_9CYAN|nr:hydrogenase subunit MbhD domain-containing protein [Gloeomargarita lithophora]APB32515.1 Putative subunit of the Multisubunit Na+/H+ antiporter [Gloeomargarita lithophora Alchichica-D10]